MPFNFFSQFKILTYEQVESTNALAWQRLKNGEAQNGDIIMARYQINGKGQGKNTWYSSEGSNLLLSFICKDIQIKATQLTQLNLLVSLSVFNTVNYFFPEITSLKWPNDILVNEHKIAGILIETALQGEYIKNAVIGIGININEENFPEFSPAACSFFTLSKKYHDLNSVFNILIEQLDKQLSKIKNGGFEEIKGEYESVLFGMGTIRYFRSGEKGFSGIIKGINSHGQLCVMVDGELKIFNNKEIEFDFGKH